VYEVFSTCGSYDTDLQIEILMKLEKIPGNVQQIMKKTILPEPKSWSNFSLRQPSLDAPAEWKEWRRSGCGFKRLF
jgi:hypothetical protein